MIRDIKQEDRNIFLEMARIFYSSEAVSHNVDKSVLEAAFDAALGKSPYIRALIIEDNNMPAGFALLSFTYSTEAGGLAVLLEDLYIREAHRGKGLGTEVMRFIEREYPEAKRFRLEVAKDNANAISLYSKLGYQAIDYMQMVKDV